MKWRCECGQVEAELNGDGTRLVCYCADCRAFVETLGKSERLDKWGGSDLIQIAPEHTKITKGQDQLRHLRLTPKGPLRWYARCCDTPVANTMPNRVLAFSSWQVHNIEPKDALPKVSARVHLKGAKGHVEGEIGNVRALIRGFFVRAFKAWLTGGWRKNPFFDKKGHPIGPRLDPDSTG